MLLMKNIFFCAFLCLCCMSTVLGREVIAFNEGWEFKKGPFPIDVMRADSHLSRTMGAGHIAAYLEC